MRPLGPHKSCNCSLFRRRVDLAFALPLLMSLCCQSCGQEHVSLVDVCPRCGHSQVPASRSPSINVMLPQPADELYGVGGWLLILCISLTIVVPLTQALIAAKALRNLATARVPIQTVLRLGSVGAIYSGLAIFSCIGGVMLWRKRPKGVSVTKGYLLVSAVLPISLFLLLHLAGMHVDLFRVIFRRSVYSVVWYSYLIASRRVKVTYGTP